MVPQCSCTFGASSSVAISVTESLPLFLSGGVVAGAAGAFGGVAGWTRFVGLDDEDMIKTKLLGSFYWVFMGVAHVLGGSRPPPPRGAQDLDAHPPHRAIIRPLPTDRVGSGSHGIAKSFAFWGYIRYDDFTIHVPSRHWDLGLL